MTDTETMPIEDYLAKGGRLTSPDNVPARYRGELLRLMASFVDSELAGSAGFAGVINDAPGIQERISAARIVLEKTDHAGQVLAVMESFGADGGRYAVHHPWADRLPRDADIGAERREGDMRLSVFHYPLQGWVDAVVMNVLMGKAGVIQLRELSHVSYQPLAEVFHRILPRETRHLELGLAGLERIAASPEARAVALASIAYWTPRVAASFGHSGSARYATLARFGLRHTPNETLLAEWQADVDAQLGALKLL
ncbi:Phenylacetic acid catabolic protein [Ensifer sp. MJa1]|uniref:Phenylacetic acid catabolic protein n=1 Tax=Ensifer sp. MJa1 TaxID=2919888 RepID=UPI00300AB5BC